MKIIFLSVLAATALSTFTTFPSHNPLGKEEKFNIVDNGENYLQNNAHKGKKYPLIKGDDEENSSDTIKDDEKSIHEDEKSHSGSNWDKFEPVPGVDFTPISKEPNNPEPSEPEEPEESETIDYWGAMEGIFDDLEGGWQAWENVFLACEPEYLVYHSGSPAYYELSKRCYICIDEWSKDTVTYIGTADYTDADFFYENVVFNAEECAFDVTYLTYNPNAVGEMYIFYTYYHYEEPPQQEEEWPEPVQYDGVVRDGKEWSNGKPTNEYSDVGFKDNKPSKATKVASDFHVDSKIHKYNWWDNIINGYATDAIDCDWFRFQIDQTIHYNIVFDAPSHAYTMTIYKYRNKDVQESTLLRRYSTSKYVNGGISLTAGTYYVKVTVASANQIEANKNYHITFTGSQTNYEFPIYSQNLKKFKGVIWENEYIPDNIADRWSTNVHELRSQIISTQLPSDKKGYFDPIFYTDEDSLSLNKMILDSVIYVWGKTELEVLAGALQQLQIGIETLRLQDYRNAEILSDIRSIVGGGASLIIKAVTHSTSGDSIRELFQGDFGAALTSLDPTGISEDIRTIVTGICDLILGSAPEQLDYFTQEDCALSLLIGCADGLSGDPKGVLAIPVYGEMDRISIEQSDNQIREAWVYKRSFVPYGKLYNAGTNEYVTIPTNKFKFSTITELQQIGKKVGNSYQVERTYHGRLKTFTDTQTLKNYIHYDNIFDPSTIYYS